MAAANVSECRTADTCLQETTTNFNNTTGSNASLEEMNSRSSDHLFDISYRMRMYLLQPSYIIALLLALVVITFNALSIMALFQIRNRLNTHYRLIISLAVSDAFVGISNVLYIINKVFNPSIVPGSGSRWERIQTRCVFVVIRALNTTSWNISLLNLMGMSLDHYLAITKPLKYQELMCARRASVMICSLWLLAFLCGFSDFLSPLSIYSTGTEHPYNYCELVFITAYQEQYTVLAIAFICLFVMLFIYIRIYLIVRHHKTPGEWSCTPSNKHESKKKRRALVTTLLILGSFIFCWLPTCLFQIITMVVMKTGIQNISEDMINVLRSADKYLLNLFLLNCLCDPIIYTVRCKEVRVGYRKLWFSWCKVKEHSTSGKSAKSSLASASSTADKQHDGTIANGSMHSLRVEQRERMLTTKLCTKNKTMFVTC